ncbi:MAG: hypothetical protein ACLR2E_07110 [Lachnospiraceae bacterium]
MWQIITFPPVRNSGPGATVISAAPGTKISPTKTAPHIELMTGVFTDNQPDFSWLKPQEEKTFVQYFMPYKGVGRVGNATKNAALSLRKEGDKALLKVYATGIYPRTLPSKSC